MMAQHEFDDWLAGGAPARRRRPVRAVLAAALVLVLLAGLVVGGYLFALARSFESKTATIAPAFPREGGLRPAANSTGATNILLLGSGFARHRRDLGDRRGPAQLGALGHHDAGARPGQRLRGVRRLDHA